MAIRRLFVMGLCIFLPAAAGACFCGRIPAKDAIPSVDIVFRGELIAHKGNAAVFRVDEQWKGELSPQVEVQWRDGSQGDCDGFWPDQLKIGQKLLVLARRSSFLSMYKTNICLPTQPVVDADEDLKELGPGRPPRKK